MKTKQRICPNCNLPLLRPSKYCPHCGQKSTDGRLTIRELLYEFSDATFNLDSRIFKSIFAIFIPGKLTTEYFKGRHRTYLHPLRLFLVLTLALVASATFQIKDSDFIGLDRELDKLKKNYQALGYHQELDSLRMKLKNEFPQKSAQAALDSLYHHVIKNEQGNATDSIPIFKKFNIGVNDEEFTIALQDLFTMEPDSILEVYQVEGTFDRYMTRQQIRIIRQGGNFGFYMIGNITWMVFFMMPFLAFILKILYIRRNYLYVEHLIFSFHVHCYAFLVYIIFLFFAHYDPAWILPVGFISIIVYLFIAMRRVYQQNRFKTFIKFAITNIAYMFIFFGSTLLTALASAALF